MAATKTIYKLSWNPTRTLAIAIALSIAAVVAVPIFFESQELNFTFYLNGWLVIALQLLVSIAGVLFFYEGIPRAQQFRILSMTLAFVFIFATAGNTIHGNDLIELMSRGEVIINMAAFGAANIAAVLCTLFIYKLEPVKVEVGSAAAVPSTPLWLGIPPAAVPIIVMALSMVLIPHAPNFLSKLQSTFRCTVPFFVATQLIFAVVGVNWLLNKKTLAQKIRHALMIIATSMTLGSLCNLINHRSSLRPGFRIDITPGEYLIMNLGALFCVIGYFVWERIRNAELAKRAELSAAAQGAPVFTASEPAMATTAASAPASALPPPSESTPQAIPETTIIKAEAVEPFAVAEPSTAAKPSAATEPPAVAGAAKTDPTTTAEGSPQAPKAAKAPGSTPNKGPSKKQKSTAQKDGSQKNSSTQSSKGPAKNNGSTKKTSSGNGQQKSAGSQPKSGNNGQGSSKAQKKN